MKPRSRRLSSRLLRRNIKLVLEYNGRDFFGFQRQDPKPTIQQTLEDAFEKLFQKRIKIKSASGRTDSGVHAEGQVVNFLVQSSIPCANIVRGLNRYLPSSVAVKSAEDVSESFHARFDAVGKCYVYRVWNHPVRSPLVGDQSFHVAYPLDVRKMKLAARSLTGKHNFKAFCAADAERYETSRKGYLRTVNRIEIRRKGPLLCFYFEADGFLYHMVRNMMGLLLAVGGGKLPPEEVRGIVKSGKRIPLIANVPAEGLCLVNVTY